MTRVQDESEGYATLRELCSGQMLAVLATQLGEGPYANLVALAVASDLRELYFATPRSTRKWSNLMGNHHVALLIDNRRNQATDICRSAAATILGSAAELAGEKREEGLKLYLGRHPYLAEFASSPSCALFRVTVQKVYLVTGFQSVLEFHFSS